MKYKGFNIKIKKLTSKNSSYILEGEPARYQTWVGSMWIGTYTTKIVALSSAKRLINNTPNLSNYRGYK